MKKNFLIILVAFFCTTTSIFSQDIDGDGFLSYADGGTDCNDNDPNVNPGAAEICDGIDNNCDGQIDEGLNTDADGDGYNSLGSCLNATDCDDNNPNVNPGAVEICDGIDNNCDGQIDEGLSTDADGDGFNSLGSCLNATDCDDNDPNVYPGAPELCDGLDNDCNGLVDDGVVTLTFYLDNDNDGFGDGSISTSGCSIPVGYVFDNTDCNDSDPNIYPGAPELCDGLDNDCDGQIDEGLNTDADGDGYNSLGSCFNATDCDDNNPNIFPGAAEICDGLDNDCNGLVDDGVVTFTFYRDSDNDGFGDGLISITGCSTPVGYVLDNTDCNDSEPSIYPGAPELCDGLDNDCDVQIDEGLNIDADGDGYNSLSSCSNATDCDDNDPNIFPGSPIDNTVSVSGITLTANASGYVYNWVDCNNSNISEGVSTQSYIPTVNGSYAVEITSGACVVISNCIDVTTVGIDEDFLEYILVYPNPSENGIFTVKYVGNINHIEVLDMLSRKVSIPIDYNSGTVDGSSLELGKYFITIETDKSVVTKEIVIIR